MPTLQDVTAAHSRRISELQRRRDAALRDALVARDTELRALPAAAALYQRADKAAAAALEDRLETERKAADARDTALARLVDARSGRLSAAQSQRRAADGEAFEEKLRADAAAEEKFRDAIAALGATTPLAVRQKASQQADEARRHDLEKARDEYAAALTTGQNTYRQAIDESLLDEWAAARRAEQAYAAALRVADSSYRAALASAERDLARGLRDLPDGREALQRYQQAASRIKADAAAEEEALFRLFREELRNAT